MNNNHNLTISFKTVFYTLLSIGVVYFLYISVDVLITLVLSIVIVLSIEPVVKEFLKFRVFGKSPFKRTSAVLTSYVLVLLTVVLSFVYAIPEVAKEFPALITTIEKTINEYSIKYNLNLTNLPDLSQYTERVVSIG